MKPYELASVLLAEPVRLYEGDIAMRTSYIGQLLIIIHMYGAFPIQDIQIRRHLAGPNLPLVVDDPENSFVTLVEPGLTMGAPAV